MSQASDLAIPIDEVLDPSADSAPNGSGLHLGSTRESRAVVGYRFGTGPHRVSLIAGCHADEPIGPAMLDRLAGYLHRLPGTSPLLTELTWYLVPHANPDGEARNAAWAEAALGRRGGTALGGSGVDVGSYLTRTVRELPGDDVEFGFPRDPSDAEARPENRAIADFLRPGAPFVLHASWHGMAFAAGPWFLQEAAWIDRFATQREHLREAVRSMGYLLHDVDRGGEKGFHRIDLGFTTRPDSRAMRAHFEALGDRATAELFRPSSMEFVRALGGDPLTLVSEMPLFILPAEHYAGGDVVRPEIVRRLTALARPEEIRSEADRLGVRAMPIADQMRLQLRFLQAGLDAALAKLG